LGASQKTMRRLPNMDEPQIRETSIGVRQIYVDERIAELSFSSETPIERAYGTEILAHDPDSVDLSRLTDIGVVLYNHDQNSVIGKVLDASIDLDNRKGIAKVQFDTDEFSEQVWQKVVSGTLKGTSVGYRVSNWEIVNAGSVSSNGRFEGPCDVATKWTPYEISICSVPADASVGVGRSEDEIETAEDIKTTAKLDNDQGESEKMDEKTRADAEVSSAEMIAAERQRAASITALCRDFGIDPQPYIEGGSAIEDVQRVILEKVRAERTAINDVKVTRDAGDSFMRAASDALCMRAGITIDKPADGSRSLMGMSLRDMAIEALRISGKPASARMDNRELFRRALTPDSQFTAITDAAVNASIAQAYQTAPTTWRQWCRVGSIRDFRPATAYRLSQAGQLEIIPQNGEFKWSELKDEGISKQLRTYGIKFGLTWEAFVNDDMGFLVDYPNVYVRGALKQVNSTVYNTLEANAAIYDGVALFAAAHNNNDIGGASAIDIQAVSAMRAAMRRQTDINGTTALNISPRYMIGPPDLETSIEQFCNAVIYPTAVASANVMAGSLIPVVDADLADDGNWYLAADPNMCPTIEVDFLNGNDMPVLESQTSWERLGQEWRIYYAWGITVVDYRGIQRNTGA
jgi:phage head maturation protease